MSLKEKDTLGVILLVVGIVLLLVVDSPSMLILFLVKLAGFSCAVSGCFLMGVKEHE